MTKLVVIEPKTGTLIRFEGRRQTHKIVLRTAQGDIVPVNGRDEYVGWINLLREKPEAFEILS